MPVAKTYPCEAGMKSTSDAVQVFGGYGFTQDFPVEQYYRDIRITPIYEGTTGIQSLDLLGRKVLMSEGKAMKLLVKEMTATMQAANEFDVLKPYSKKLGASIQNLTEVTQHLMKKAGTGDIELFLSDATLYMELFCLETISWQWLKMATAASKALQKDGITADDKAFYNSKVKTMKFYFHYELPKSAGFSTRLLDEEVITILREGEEVVF
jgi:hypothetical protein